MNHLTFAALSGMEFGMIFGLSGLAFGAFFGGLGMYFHHKRNALWHETARIALEKGQPLPPRPDETGWGTKPGPRADATNDLRGGLVLIAVGIGLYLFLGNFLGRGLGFVGAIPGLIGVALLLSWLVQTIFRKNDSKTGGPTS